MTTKICKDCKTPKEITENFTKHRQKYGDGYLPRCKPCQNLLLKKNRSKEVLK